jgi:hypothetical protein
MEMLKNCYEFLPLFKGFHTNGNGGVNIAPTAFAFYEIPLALRSMRGMKIGA